MKLKEMFLAIMAKEKKGRFCRGNTPWNKGLYQDNSQTAKILKRLCDGEWIGGREAVVETKSHNAPTRLRALLKTFRQNAICYAFTWHTSPSGKTYKVFQILPHDRERARTLIRGAR